MSKDSFLKLSSGQVSCLALNFPVVVLLPVGRIKGSWREMQGTGVPQFPLQLCCLLVCYPAGSTHFHHSPPLCYNTLVSLPVLLGRLGAYTLLQMKCLHASPGSSTDAPSSMKHCKQLGVQSIILLLLFQSTLIAFMSMSHQTMSFLHAVFYITLYSCLLNIFSFLYT